MPSDMIRVGREALTDFCRAVFERLGLSAADAAHAADVLVAADVRGIPSHGVGRLQRYVNGLRSGQILPDARPETVHETDASIVVDAHGGMGAPVSVRTMRTVIEKAGAVGAAFGCVRDSNHFGIAGYYAMMALEADMLGIAMTNTAALGVPTFGREAMFGTNPIAFAAPAGEENAFVLDMSTTVVSRGKIELMDRAGEALPLGWAVDSTGLPATDAGRILADMLDLRGGGILPLGGAGEQFGGHKGYGLAVMVDVLCAVLAGAPSGPQVRDTATSSARVSHFFGAISVSAFRDVAAFKADMNALLTRLRACRPAEGKERVYYAGQKEFEHAELALRLGVPVQRGACEALRAIARELSIPAPPVTGD